MNNKEIKEISNKMFQSINHFVIHHDFTLEVYNLTNDNLKRLVINDDDGVVLMNNFIYYIYHKIITQIIIRGLDKTIKVFVREKELENDSKRNV